MRIAEISNTIASQYYAGKQAALGWKYKTYGTPTKKKTPAKSAGGGAKKSSKANKKRGKK